MEDLLIPFSRAIEQGLLAQQARTGAAAGIARLTPQQVNYLAAIDDLGEPTLTEIAEHLHISTATATTTVKKLARMRLVLKTPCMDDARQVRVSLTRSGTRLARVRTRALKEFGKSIRTVLSEDEVRRLTTMLTKMIRLVNEI